MMMGMGGMAPPNQMAGLGGGAIDPAQVLQVLLQAMQQQGPQPMPPQGQPMNPMLAALMGFGGGIPAGGPAMPMSQGGGY